MAMEELRIAPGFDIEKTPSYLKTGWSAGAFVRWKEGLPEKLGGWVRFYPFAMNTFVRALHVWADLVGTPRLAVGAEAALNVITQGLLRNITPQETLTNTAPNFSTVINTPTVTIIDSNISNPSTNDFVVILTPVSVGGLILQGIYQIQSIISSTSYTITASSSATATVNNVGAVPSYAVTNTSNLVTVTLNNHGLTVGSNFNPEIATIVGGIPIGGDYTVINPITTNTFTIAASVVATSTTSGSVNGGNVAFAYFIAISPQSSPSGWGVGTWGQGGWGTGIPLPQGLGTPILASDYSLLNFGGTLIANPAGQPLFQWDPLGSLLNAQIIPQAPIVADGIVLVQPAQIIIAWGVAFQNRAPRALRLVWCDAGDFTNWTPTSTDFAGGFTISRGSKIVAVVSGANQFTVHTDIGVWSGQYIGQPLVFSILEVMSGCGLVGRKAVGVYGTTTYWMSQNQFFQMAAGGVPVPMACPVWDRVFQRIDRNNYQHVRFFSNSQFNEIGWYFPVTGFGGENTEYVKYNVLEGEWDFGQFGRSAWTDQSILGPPIGAFFNGIIYQHEIGYDADGVAMTPSITTGNFSIGQGEEFGFVDYMIPDAIYGPNSQPQTAALLITLFFRAFPNDAPVIEGPFNSTAQIPFIEPHQRGRLLQITFQSQDLGSFWRLGLPRLRIAPDGRNPL